MDDFIKVENHGPLITGSNYWECDYAVRGYFYLSINAGTFRLLLPDSRRGDVADMRVGLRHVIVSMLPVDQFAPSKYVCEWLCEDHSEDPWTAYLSEGQIDRHPTAEDVGKEWLATVWIRKRGKPHKVFERPAYFQIVPKIPWGTPIQGS